MIPPCAWCALVSHVISGVKAITPRVPNTRAIGLSLSAIEIYHLETWIVCQFKIMSGYTSIKITKDYNLSYFHANLGAVDSLACLLQTCTAQSCKHGVTCQNALLPWINVFKFESIVSLWTNTSQLSGLERSGDKTSYRLVNSNFLITSILESNPLCILNTVSFTIVVPIS